MNENKGYHIHITAEESPMTRNLREVWEYRDLIRLLTERSFKLIYKQTILGPIWILLNPLLTSGIYTAVFGEMAGLSTAGVPKFLFYFCSHTLWTFFADCLSKNSSTFITNANVFGKVYFPRLTIPISTMLSAFIQFLIQMAMVSVILIWHVVRGEVHPDWRLFPLLIPVLLLTGLLGLGLGILISSITTKYRDLRYLVSFGLHLWMYITPVIYPVSQFSGGLIRKILLLNPMTALMELFRMALLGTGYLEPASLASTLVFTLLAVWGGVKIFNRVERTFIDTV